MYYLPLLYVPYKQGDENVVFDNHVSATNQIKDNTTIKAAVHPNPVGHNNVTPVHITFEMERGMPATISIHNMQGQLVRTLRDNEYYSQGEHIVHLGGRLAPPRKGERG